MRKPNQKVITRKDLINQIISDFDGRYSKAEITRILDDLEFNIVDQLLQATENHGVQVRLFSGLQLISSYVPEEADKNRFGQKMTIPARLKAKAKLSRYFVRQFNEEWRNNEYGSGRKDAYGDK